MFKRVMIIADNYKLIDSLLRYTPILFPDAEYHVVSVVDYSYDIMSATSFVDDSLERTAVSALFPAVVFLGTGALGVALLITTSPEP